MRVIYVSPRCKIEKVRRLIIQFYKQLLGDVEVEVKVEVRVIS